MNQASRVKAILADPAGEWDRIEKESGDPAYLLSNYVALLALVPAVFGFVGTCVIGAVVPIPRFPRELTETFPFMQRGFAGVEVLIPSQPELFTTLNGVLELFSHAWRSDT